MNKKNSILLLIIFAFSCQRNQDPVKRFEGRTYILENSQKLYSKLDSCMPKANGGFQEFNGIKISSDYLIIDSLSLDLNRDHLPDKIMVLSPRLQEEDELSNKCYNSPFNNRLLVTILSQNDKYIIGTVNERLILNNSEFYSLPYKKLNREADGFSINFFVGSTIRCRYKFTFKGTVNNCYLQNSKYSCYVMDLSKDEEKEIKYNQVDSTKLENVDIRKFITIPNLREGDKE